MPSPQLAYIPTFNDVAIFGPAAHIRGRLTDVARQTRGFVGVNGLLTIAYGNRGAAAEAFGCLFGTTVELLLEQEELFEAYVLDGRPYTLIDSMSKTWNQMIMTSFERTSDPYQDQTGWCREYRASFIGLVIPETPALP